nr:MAG TPA: hypothetical protein [Caudoviricetes sp.]
MSIGEMMDIVITFTNIFDYDTQTKNQTVRNATQEDFDRF